MDDVSGWKILREIKNRLNSEFEEKGVKIGVYRKGRDASIFWVHDRIDCGVVLPEIDNRFSVNFNKLLSPDSYSDINSIKKDSVADGKFLFRVDEYDDKKSLRDSGMPGYFTKGFKFLNEGDVISFLSNYEEFLMRKYNRDERNIYPNYFVRSPLFNFSFPIRSTWNHRDRRAILGFNSDLLTIDNLLPELGGEVGNSTRISQAEYSFPYSCIDGKFNYNDVYEMFIDLRKMLRVSTIATETIELQMPNIEKLQDRLRGIESNRKDLSKDTKVIGIG